MHAVHLPNHFKNGRSERASAVKALVDFRIYSAHPISFHTE
ncbi:hypothetical protein BO443_250012 [Burkholderia orbicola]